MDRIKQYLIKQGKEKGLIQGIPADDLEIIVVIPAYKEPSLIETLKSLSGCKMPPFSCEVIVLINGRIDDKEEVNALNEASYGQCMSHLEELTGPKLTMHFLKDLNMPTKKGGVGLARKTLMDEAAFRFLEIGNKRGIIVNLDADCKVETNYLLAIGEYFRSHPQMKAASIHFEHEITSDFIIHYELHLRYFIGIQKEIGLPFAFQTIGSAMATTVESYAAVGGMNSRKAGEDFYFLHKFIKNGICGNLVSTKVSPSGRASDRVPFGTGRAVQQMQETGNFLTYNPESFLHLHKLTSNLHAIYSGNLPEDLNAALFSYLKSINFSSKVEEIRNNTRDFHAFRKRFFQYFDAFKLMKYLHFMRDEGLEDVSLTTALANYFDMICEPYSEVNLNSLEILRNYDKQNV